jgi:hypothetical protein
MELKIHGFFRVLLEEAGAPKIQYSSKLKPKKQACYFKSLFPRYAVQFTDDTAEAWLLQRRLFQVMQARVSSCPTARRTKYRIRAEVADYDDNPRVPVYRIEYVLYSC